MKTRAIKLNGRIILMFSIAILSTFIPEFYPTFFGDWLCEGAVKEYSDTGYRIGRTGCHYALTYIHSPEWHWGYRHWLYFAMCLVLFVIQVVNIIADFSAKEDACKLD